MRKKLKQLIGILLTLVTDFKVVSYANNTKTGTAKVTIRKHLGVWTFLMMNIYM